MENRSEIVKELFELRVLLNRANKLADEQTEVDFEIVGNYFVAFIEEIIDAPFVLLAERTKTKKWQASSAPYCYSLQEAIANELNKIQAEMITSSKNQGFINEILLYHVKEKLRSLLLENLD